MVTQVTNQRAAQGGGPNTSTKTSAGLRQEVEAEEWTQGGLGVQLPAPPHTRPAPMGPGRMFDLGLDLADSAGKGRAHIWKAMPSQLPESVN